MGTKKARQESLEQSTVRAVEAMTRVAEANQKALGEMVTLAAGTASEAVRLYGEAQASAFQAAKAGRVYWLRRVADLEDLQKAAI